MSHCSVCGATRVLMTFAAAAVVTACSRDANGSRPAGKTDGGTRSDGQSVSPSGATTRSATAGVRATPSITLASSDIAVIAPTTIEDGVALTGDLRPIETIDVRARIEGDLTAVLFREGQQVSAGQVLARFEASEQESAQKSAEADRTAASADLANAQWTYEQDASLYKAGAIAQRDFKNAEQAVAAARARLAAADARLRATSNQSRDTRVIAPASGVINKRLLANC